MIAGRQTHTHAYALITILRSPIGGEVVTAIGWGPHTTSALSDRIRENVTGDSFSLYAYLLNNIID